MSEPNTPYARLPREQPGEEAAREERHQLLASLLGAFADGELPAETVSQIDAHLLGCARCRRELQVHRALRLRLEQEPLTAAPSALRARIAAAIVAAPRPQWETVAVSSVPAATPAVVLAPAAAPRVRVSRLVWLVSALVAVGFGGYAIATSGGRETPVTMVAISSQSVFAGVLDDYARVMSADLPGRSRDLGTVRAAVSFPVEVLRDARLRLLGAWTTTLEGEQAAVMAYRWNNAVVLQYVVSDQQAYRSPVMRAAFAEGRLMGAQAGNHRLVAWSEPTVGTFVVGDIPIEQLRSLRGRGDQR